MFRDIFGISLLVGVLVIAPLGASSPYFLITPGGTYEIGTQPRADGPPRLTIPDEYRKPMGRMAFTAVYEQEASWAEVAHAQIAGQAEIVPAIAIRPPGTTQEQVNATNQRLIDESKPVAAVVGLRAAGFPVEITGQGAQVQSILSGMPADGVLQVGDIITAVDGTPITTTDSLVQAVTAHAIGDSLTLTVHRGDQDISLPLRTATAPDGNRPIIGVTISTYLFDVHMPFPVEIQSDNVGGPSAGFMFALAILDGVTDGDLTRGYFVAGTGTIAQDGTVGAVGGAAEKALAAEHDGAQIFLVPKDDAADAGRWVHNLRIISVAKFQDAVDALCALTPLPSAASPDPPTPCG
ncbi:MAG: PDZ domain-containing protein [Chloroflexi bacterium]|nr:PDZ domain-containing protein [Chloroflexota bacterium]MBV9134657.1 PDZ domain-containing protein [Chloroflexota bacterium]MBV9893323.1 PDZ domain-containing protein [Chloroflexota bacterium]